MTYLKKNVSSVQQYINYAVKKLSINQFNDCAKLDAHLIVAYSCGWTIAQLLARLTDPFPEEAVDLSETLLMRRQSGEPIAYLFQKRDFWDFTLHVNADTLIPRPETELLVESALTRIPHKGWIIDAGTGTGAIALALSASSLECEVIALDKSWGALQVAAVNKQLTSSSLHLLCGHWLQSFKNDSIQMIVSNPPYLAENDPHLAQGDVRFEPITALVSGKTGLETYQEIIPEAMRVLQSSGLLGVEHGIHQEMAIQELFEKSGFKNIEFLKDLAGISRVIWGQKI